MKKSKVIILAVVAILLANGFSVVSAMTEKEARDAYEQDVQKGNRPDVTTNSFSVLNFNPPHQIQAYVRNIGTGVAGPHYTYFFEDFGLQSQACLGR